MLEPINIITLFSPSTVRAWNNLPVEIKQSASVQCLKDSSKNHRQPQIPKYYYVGSRRAQVLHTRLRTNCSSLNLHLFLKILLTHHCVGVAALRTQNIFFFTVGIIRTNAMNFYL